MKTFVEEFVECAILTMKFLDESHCIDEGSR